MYTLIRCPVAVSPPGTQSVMATVRQPRKRQAHFHTDEATGCRGGLRRCCCCCCSLVSPLRCRPEILMTFFLCFSFFSFLLSVPRLHVSVCLCVHVVSLSFSIHTEENKRQCNFGRNTVRIFKRACTSTPVEDHLRAARLGFLRLAALPTF